MKYAISGCLALMLLCVGCQEQSSSYEVAHVVSPDGRLEAVLNETNGGATTSFGYVVSIGPKGSKTRSQVASLYGAIRSEHAYGINLRWQSEKVLSVQYLQAKAIQQVSNTITVDGRQLGIVLQSGVNDSTAPPGGMYYNLSQHSH